MVVSGRPMRSVPAMAPPLPFERDPRMDILPRLTKLISLISTSLPSLLTTKVTSSSKMGVSYQRSPSTAASWERNTKPPSSIRESTVLVSVSSSTADSGESGENTREFESGIST